MKDFRRVRRCSFWAATARSDGWGIVLCWYLQNEDIDTLMGLLSSIFALTKSHDSRVMFYRVFENQVYLRDFTEVRNNDIVNGRISASHHRAALSSYGLEESSSSFWTDLFGMRDWPNRVIQRWHVTSPRPVCHIRQFCVLRKFISFEIILNSKTDESD